MKNRLLLAIVSLFILCNMTEQIYADPISTKKIPAKIAYLTFDDGPSYLTKKVIDILRERNIKATFFVNGKAAGSSSEILKQLAAEGHTIGNHTFSHQYSYIYKNKENFFEDFYKNEKLIYELTGKRTKIVRLPGGSNNSTSKLYGTKNIMDTITEELESSGYIYFDWNVSSRDANGKNLTVSDIVYETLTQSSKRDQAIILFHDTTTKVNTVEALPEIIDGLEKQGFSFAPLTEESYRVAFRIPKKNVIEKPAQRQPKSKYLLWKLKKIEEITEGVIIS